MLSAVGKKKSVFECVTLCFEQTVALSRGQQVKPMVSWVSSLMMAEALLYFSFRLPLLVFKGSAQQLVLVLEYQGKPKMLQIGAP